MQFKLNNDKVFFIGVGIIFSFMLLNRLQFYIGSKTAIGTVVGYERSSGKNGFVYTPMIQFKADSIQYQVRGIKDMEVSLNDTLELIYRTSDPNGAVINSFPGFWLYPILFCLIPLIFWISFVYSYITAKEFLLIKIGKKDHNDFTGSNSGFVRFRKEIDK